MANGRRSVRADPGPRNSRASSRSTTRADAGVPVTVSAVNLHALTPLAQALDTFSVVYLQWLSNDVIWRARERVFSDFRKTLENAWSYDLDVVATAVGWALEAEAAEARRATGRLEACRRLPTRVCRERCGCSATAAREVVADNGEAAACAGDGRRESPHAGRALERAIASSAARRKRADRPEPDEIDSDGARRLFVATRRMPTRRAPQVRCRGSADLIASPLAYPIYRRPAQRTARRRRRYRGGTPDWTARARGSRSWRGRRDRGRTPRRRRLAAQRTLRPVVVPARRSRQAGRVQLPAPAIQPRAALDGAADSGRSDQQPRAHAVAARSSRSSPRRRSKRGIS